MGTANSLFDLHFAQTYVEFLARGSNNVDTRMRARFLQATIETLDAKYPPWRAQLINELDARSMALRVEDIPPLPTIDDQQLLDNMLSAILEPKGE